MYKNKTISLCLPCRDEAANLPVVLKTVPQWVDEVIVISNCSSDDSMAVAKHQGVKAIEDNRTIDGIGYGFAHLSGIENATGDIIVGADCDGSYPLAQLANVLDYLLDNQLDFVSCNRYPLRDGTKISPLLKLGVLALNLECRLLYGLKINDILSGMWVFRRGIVSDLSLTAGDWNLSPQIKLNAATNSDIAFGEYNICQYQRGGRTKQAYIKTGWSHLTWILNNRWPNRSITQLLSYGLVAVMAQLIDLTLLYSLVQFRLNYILAASIAYCGSMLVNYLISVNWVFKANSRKASNFLVFWGVGLIGLALTDLIMWTLTSGLGVRYMISKLLSLGIVFFWSFGARRRFLRPSVSLLVD